MVRVWAAAPALAEDGDKLAMLGTGFGDWVEETELPPPPPQIMVKAPTATKPATARTTLRI
jgi:hypothetical protein